MTELSRRTFFTLAAATVAAAATPGIVSQAAALVATPDPLGSWLLCDGRTVSRAAYPELFAVLGNMYPKVGEDWDLFSLPDTRGFMTTDRHTGEKYSLAAVGSMYIKARPDNTNLPVGMIQMAYGALK